MDVRCERCRAQYAVDDARVSEAGVPVTCTQCGHAFLLRKKVLAVTVPLKGPDAEGARPLGELAPGAATTPAAPVPSAAPPAVPAPGPIPEAPSEWRLRHVGGAVYPFRELSTLQRWIVERKAGRGDEVASADGGPWRRLEDIPELQSFFALVERAERRLEPQPASPAEPVPGRASAPVAEDPAWASGPVAPSRRITRSALRPVKPRRRVIWVVLLVVGLVGVAAATYLLRARAAGDAVAMTTTAPQVAKDPPSASPPGPLPATRAAQGAVALDPATAPLGTAAVADAPASAAGATGGPAAPAGTPAEPVRVSTTGTAPPAGPPASAPREASARPPPATDPAAGVRALLSRARDQRERGRCESALDLYGQVLAQDGSNGAALAGRGACYLDLSRYVQAEASFEAALESDPRNADALYGMAETYRFMGRKAEAVAYYERFLAVRSTGDDAAAARRLVAQLKE